MTNEIDSNEDGQNPTNGWVCAKQAHQHLMSWPHNEKYRVVCGCGYRSDRYYEHPEAVERAGWHDSLCGIGNSEFRPLDSGP